jgi:polysaccharide deacetylase 2 family uncharacterized protein YibQ
MKNFAYKVAIGILLAVIIILCIVMLSIRVPKKAPKIPLAVQGRIAIVLDDWGYNNNNLEILGQIKYPFTASILPNLNYSRQVAEELHARGFEIILHLPMEPNEKYRLEKNTIMTSLDDKTITKIIDLDLKSITYAVGVSNHMGSAATQDPRTMAIVFKELKNKHVFFLDSFVTPKSVCSALSTKIGIGFARRDVFLDNIEEAEYIKGQIYKLKSRAKTKGYAIGIGHDRRITLEVLREVMPQLEKEGYKLVFLSELVR